MLLLSLEGSSLLKLELPVGGHHAGKVHVQASGLHVVDRHRLSMVAAGPAEMRLLVLVLVWYCVLLRNHLAMLT